MYFKNKNSFPHGIMFHHFHDNSKHLKTQGSITEKKFREIIKYVGINNIANPEEFIEIINSNVSKKKVCFTFDDGLLCQYDIALKVLNDLGIKGFFFIYTSILDKKPDLLEIYRFFRINYFKSVNDFYLIFFKKINYDLDFYFKIHDKLIKETKKKFPFYSILDIKFRLVRDNYLNSFQYKNIMESLMNEKKFEYKKFYKKLFLNKKHIINLVNTGHYVGLHTHTHPTKLEELSYLDQEKNYMVNKNKLEDLFKNKKFFNVFSMSHPCGSYNHDTLQILNKMKILIGFKQIMTIEKEKGMKKINNSNLEIARIDHSLLLKLMKKK
jgi:peptidoglycan/xylan/chitin deacetylase (PgdA/CDA1 family)